MPSTRGWGPWREDYHSYCSAHQTPNAKCKTCAQGVWVNRWRRHVEGLAHAVSPRLWKWWVNR